MRLIDADELMDFISEHAEQIQYAIEHKDMEILESSMKQIPTAYDVDKVVYEINNKIQELDDKQKLFIENGLFNMADKMASKIGIYIECREIVEKSGGTKGDGVK